MAEYQHNNQEEGVETGGRGLFDFTKKKDEDEQVISSEFDEKSRDEEECDKEKLQQDKLERDTEVPVEKIYVEEEEEAEIKDKLPGHQAGDDVAFPPPTPAPVVGEERNAPPPAQEEKIHVEEEEEIKDKLPGHQAGDDVACPLSTPAQVVGEECNAPPPAQEEKKGLLEKIKDKIPGLHSKDTSTTACEEEEEKAKE